MNRLIFVLMLSFCTPVFAAGTWGGGTPPAIYKEVGVWLTEKPVLRTTVQKGEAAMVPSVRADTLISLGDGVTIVPVSETLFKWIVKSIKRKGEATIVVDNGLLLQFINDDGWPVDAENLARAVNVDDREDRIDDCKEP